MIQRITSEVKKYKCFNRIQFPLKISVNRSRDDSHSIVSGNVKQEWILFVVNVNIDVSDIAIVKYWQLLNKFKVTEQVNK